MDVLQLAITLAQQFGLDAAATLDRLGSAEDPQAEAVKITKEQENPAENPAEKQDGAAVDEGEGVPMELEGPPECLRKEPKLQERYFSLPPTKQREYKNITETVPGVNRDWLLTELLEAHVPDVPQPEGSMLLIRLVERNEYPLEKDRQASIAAEERAKELLRLDTFDPDSFLRNHPNFEEEFAKYDIPKSDLYKAHALAFMQNEFTCFQQKFIEKCLAERNGHLYATYEHIKTQFNYIDDHDEVLRKHYKPERLGSSRLVKKPGPPLHTFRPKPMKGVLAMPKEVDEKFYRDARFLKSKDRVIARANEKREQRQQRVMELRAHGSIEGCDCCAEDEVLPDELMFCSGVAASGNGTGTKHAFCKTCVARFAHQHLMDLARGVAEGSPATALTCLDNSCKASYDWSQIKDLLTDEDLAYVGKHMTKMELDMSGLPLTWCPVCSYAVDMEDANRVLTCPNCFQEFCRDCDKPAHIGFKCQEVEDKAVGMRKYIENAMAEALMRTCPRATCGMRIVKESGCNKMVCGSCGTWMCYSCGAHIPNGYQHFGGNGCILQDGLDRMHTDRVIQAGQQAKEEYLAANPGIQYADAFEDVDVAALADRFAGNNGHPQ